MMSGDFHHEMMMQSVVMPMNVWQQALVLVLQKLLMPVVPLGFEPLELARQ